MSVKIEIVEANVPVEEVEGDFSALRRMIEYARGEACRHGLAETQHILDLAALTLCEERGEFVSKH
jgi:hypothetical protein